MVDIYDAINLFKFSPTGKGERSDQGESYALLARRVISKLWQLYRQGEIGFLQRNERLGGASDPDGRPGSYDLVINLRFANDLATTSLIMVHEAVHFVMNDRLINEEMKTRKLNLMFYDDLLTGIEIRSHQDERPLFVQVEPLLDINDCLTMKRHNDRNQLVDFVLWLHPDHRNPANVDAEWIRDTFEYWGGIANRWGATKGLYIKRLAADGESNADRILTIMESVNSEEQLQNVLREAGGLENLPALLRTRLVNPQFLNRVQSVQDRWRGFGQRVYLGAGSR